MPNANTRTHAVVKLSIDRRYGGPEEGGWWYDHTDVEEVIRTGSKSAAKRLLGRLRAAQPKPRYDRSSVLGGPDRHYVRVTSLAEARELQSTRRPRYE